MRVMGQTVAGVSNTNIIDCAQKYICYSDFRGFYKSDVNYKIAAVIKNLIRNCEKKIYARELKNLQEED